MEELTKNNTVTWNNFRENLQKNREKIWNVLENLFSDASKLDPARHRHRSVGDTSTQWTRKPVLFVVRKVKARNWGTREPSRPYGLILEQEGTTMTIVNPHDTGLKLRPGVGKKLPESYGTDWSKVGCRNW